MRALLNNLLLIAMLLAATVNAYAHGEISQNQVQCIVLETSYFSEAENNTESVNYTYRFPNHLAQYSPEIYDHQSAEFNLIQKGVIRAPPAFA